MIHRGIRCAAALSCCLTLMAGCGSPTPASSPAGSGGHAPGMTSGSPGGGGSGGAPGTGGAGGAGGSGGGQGRCVSASDAGLAVSKWVYVGADGKLAYATLPKGERILDFSDAGYMGGGVALPAVMVARTVSPSGHDDTSAIQAAIDAVSALSPTQGLRGAVLLAPGHFQVDGPLHIGTSGVVLRGSGSDANGTVLDIGGSPRAVLSLAGSGSWKTQGTPAKITDTYVPSGTRSFHVDDTSGLEVGAPVLVDRPVTTAWIHFMGMDHLVRNGQPQTWIAEGSVIHADRVITAVSGTEVTVDAPLSDSLDAKYTSATVAPYTFSGRISQVGVEAMRIVAPKQTVPISDPIFSILDMNSVVDGWVRDVTALEFTNGIVVGGTSKRITIEDVSITRTAPIDGSAGYPFSYSIDGQQVLVQRSSAEGDKVFAYATQARSPGPNVVLHFSAKGNWTNLQPHQRWSTGLLLDNIDTPGGAIELLDRGYYGSGHGWTIGFGVVWNAVAQSLVVQQPPGSMNWSIGSKGMEGTAAEPGSGDKTPLPQGIVDSPNAPVAPQSLYLAQLCERLGPQALTSIGW
jgi:hypothetical protein